MYVQYTYLITNTFENRIIYNEINVFVLISLFGSQTFEDFELKLY